MDQQIPSTQLRHWTNYQNSTIYMPFSYRFMGIINPDIWTYKKRTKIFRPCDPISGRCQFFTNLIMEVGSKLLGMKTIGLQQVRNLNSTLLEWFCTNTIGQDATGICVRADQMWITAAKDRIRITNLSIRGCSLLLYASNRGRIAHCTPKVISLLKAWLSFGRNDRRILTQYDYL